MSLSSALATAQGIFTNTGMQMAVSSKNISNASNPDYQRRDTVLSTTTFGAQVVTTQRAQSESLTRHNLDALSSSSGQQRLLDGLEELKSVMGGNDYETAPATYIATLRNSLQAYAAKPGETTLAESVIVDANNVANSISSASATVQKLRTDIDSEIVLKIKDLNTYLKDFKIANDTVKGGTALNQDVNNALDQRDSALKKISELVGVSTMTRANNDMVLYTTDGTVLFETTPRQVAFVPLPGYDAATVGNPLTIDGVPVEQGQGGNSTASGKLAAMLQLRDTVAPLFQSQLDEMANGLVNIFAEKDQSGGGQPDMPGLFTWQSGTVPTPGTLTPGMSSSLEVNTALITSKGGNPKLLRDGGINGPDYLSNTTGAAGFSDLLKQLSDNMEAEQTFDPATQIDSNASIMSFATSSLSWLEQLRSDATNSNDTKQALYARTTEALTNKVGVSLDEELSLLLDLEQSYKASTKLVSTVDAMMQALMGMVR